jgi:hypothetical protein
MIRRYWATEGDYSEIVDEEPKADDFVRYGDMMAAIANQRALDATLDACSRFPLTIESHPNSPSSPGVLTLTDIRDHYLAALKNYGRELRPGWRCEAEMTRNGHVEMSFVAADGRRGDGIDATQTVEDATGGDL